MKKRIFNIAGALAVLLASGLVLMGCEIDDGSTEKGSITVHISNTSGGPAITTSVTGVQLYAVLTRDNVSSVNSPGYAWEKDGTKVSPRNPNETSVLTPSEAGSYTVTAGISKSDGSGGSLTATSDAVTVTAAP
jgi:hypothetical protein